MTHVSRKRLDTKTKRYFYNLLVQSLTDLNSTDINKVLSILLTNTEKVMLYKRLLIIYLLNKNYSLTQIKNITKTTIQTVERIRFQMNTYDFDDINLLLGKLDQKEEKIKLKDIIMAILDTDISKSSFKKKISPF
jgi:Trp operon repressor